MSGKVRRSRREKTPRRKATSRGARSPVVPQRLQLNGVRTPGAASPTLSVDQWASAVSGSWSTSHASPPMAPLLHEPLERVVPDALAGPVPDAAGVVGPPDHAVVGAGV